MLSLKFSTLYAGLLKYSWPTLHVQAAAHRLNLLPLRKRVQGLTAKQAPALLIKDVQAVSCLL